MTNEAILAILALPDIPERQLRFLLALGTFSRGRHGWRQAGTKLLASKAGLSPTTAVKARGELVKAGTVEFVRGRGRGLSAYRIGLPGVDDPSTNNAGDQPSQPSTNSAGDQPDAVEYQPGLRRGPTGPDLITRPNAPASGNAIEGSSTSGSKSSGSNDRARYSPQPGADRRAAQPPGSAPGPADDDDFDSSTKRASLNGRAEGATIGAARPAPQGRAARPAHAWENPPGPGYGQCPDCGRWVSVNLGGGRIVPHTGLLDGRECPGSRHRPVNPVPCAGCGNTTVALRTDGRCMTCRRNRWRTPADLPPGWPGASRAGGAGP